METPNYVKALLLPTPKRAQARKVWSIDLEQVWLPFFTATNVAGDTRVAPESLGAPLRLAYDADGSVKFSKTGKPIFKVEKTLSDQIRLVRENFTIGLVSFAEGIAKEKPEEYQAEVKTAREAGAPILNKDMQALLDATVAMLSKKEPEPERELVGASA